MIDKLKNPISIKKLSGIKVSGKSVTIGATTKHAEVASSKEVQKAIPALAKLAGNIGDAQVRNRGTIGGSIAKTLSRSEAYEILAFDLDQNSIKHALNIQSIH